jgi:AcrR family transcriptional regulator
MSKVVADKRPSPRNPAEKSSTREKILRTALRLFSEQGYDGTSTKQICDAAKVNIAAITYHFGTKEALLNAIFSTQMSADLLAVSQLLREANTREEFEIRIRMLCDVLTGLKLKNQAFHQLIEREAERNENAFRAFKRGIEPFDRELTNLPTVSFFILDLLISPVSNPVAARLNPEMDFSHPKKLDTYLSRMLRILFHGVMSESEKYYGR